MKTLVIIPTYNEAENVKLTIRAVLDSVPGIEVLIVDDNSPDKTWRKVQKLKRENKRVHLIKNKVKVGLGPACMVGFIFALGRKFDYIIQMDCDFSHDPKMIPTLLSYAKKFDFVVGSRYTEGGRVTGWEKRRLLLSNLGNRYARLFLGRKIKDWTSGFICWKEKTLRSIDLDIEDYPQWPCFFNQP